MESEYKDFRNEGVRDVKVNEQGLNSVKQRYQNNVNGMRVDKI